MNTRNILSSIALLFVVSIFWGCKPSDIIIVDESADGSEIELQVGQKLVVSLDGNPTTGYIWEMAGECALLEKLDESKFEPKSDLIGSPGKQTLVFEAVKSGSEPLELVYHRPWEKETPPAKAFSLKLKVK